MPLFSTRSIFKRTRRPFEGCILTGCTLIVLIVFTRWSLSSTQPRRPYEKVRENVYLPQEQAKPKNKLPEPVDPIDTLDHGRPELAKYIHLDLKGAPPRAAPFYDSFFSFMNKLQMGVKGVLIEYEDTLPLQGNLANTTHREAYTKAEIESIRASAKTHQMEIIPLIQTFGHFEWLLKLPGYESYRDNPSSPMIITPCIEETYVLLEDLLRQTLDLHPDSTIIHIGCDEVRLRNAHQKCRSTAFSVSEQYIRHVRRVVDIVLKIRPGIRILIWDDIVRDAEIINDEKLLNQLKGLVEPVSWNYRPKFDEQYKSSAAWKVYSKLFSNVWAASAFKGGLHRFSMTTDTAHHVSNNRQWLHFMESPSFPRKYFTAIILTGWSRFDHFMALCDLFPTAYPSLIYSLHAINTNRYISDDQSRDCDALIRSIGKDPQLCEIAPGVSIWSSIASYSSFIQKVQQRLKFFETVAPDYNREHSFVRGHDLRSYISELKGLQRDFLSTKQALQRHMSTLYATDVVDEWLDLYVTSFGEQIETILSQFSTASEQKVWPRRPLV